MSIDQLAEFLNEKNQYSIISINPFTDLTLDMPMITFMIMFNDKLNNLVEILNILKEKSIELEDNYFFYLRSDEDLMVENSEDGIFTAHFPLNVNSKKEANSNLRYLNILVMPKGSKILFVGNIVKDFDTIIAPKTEFHLAEKHDEFTTL